MTEERTIEELLVEHGVRPTANRILIARSLSLAGRPMSMSELEYEIDSIDKSNIFRALTAFKKAHMVHTIEDGSDNVKYELCHSHDEHEHDNDLHAHFYCEKCHRTFCLENIPVPDVALPQGYNVVSTNFVIKGTCPDCSE